MREWKFSTSISSDRTSALLVPTNMGVIASQIASNMEILCCEFDTCDDHADFRRVIYCVKVSQDLFDLFFNSPHGYRGAYFRSPDEGIGANATLIQTLAPKLLEMSATRATPVDQEQIRKSLFSSSAKAWLAESGSNICPECEGEWWPPQDTASEINNDRWELSSTNLGRWGRMAPRFTKIRIFGAFLDDRENEFISPRKKNRACDIHMYGWS